jgi:uncharacterized membrane protein
MNQSSENPTAASDADHKARQVELLISTLLRVGVIVSLMTVIAGMAVTFIHHREYLHSKAELTHLTTARAIFPDTLPQTLAGLRHGEGRSIVVIGLLLLIATPVMRVAVSIFAFVYERDWIFVAITSLVLALLLLSFVLGSVGG